MRLLAKSKNFLLSAAETDRNAQYALLTWYQLKPTFNRLVARLGDQFSQHQLDEIYSKGRSIILRDTYASLQFTDGPRQAGSVAGNIYSIFHFDNQVNAPQNAPVQVFGSR